MVKLSVAPSQGLFLDMSYFDLYCARSTFAHEKLEWGENGSEATKRWEEFKREKVRMRCFCFALALAFRC